MHHNSRSSCDVVIYGFGQIGQTLTNQIIEQKNYFENKLNIDLPIIALCDSSGALLSDTADGFESSDLDYATEIKSKGEKFEASHKALITSEWIDLLSEEIWSKSSLGTILVDNTAIESI